MFSDAYRVAKDFTHPVIISTRNLRNNVQSGLATFIVVNEEGWILTAAHVGQSLITHQQHLAERQKYEEQVLAIEADTALSRAQRKQRIGRLVRNDRWVTNHSYWWGWDNVSVDSLAVDLLADLALGQLKPFDKTLISSYPIFKKPDSDPRCGTSLCRLGFPFHEIKSTYDQESNRFILGPGTLPVPRFPLEGILTRLSIVQNEASDRTCTFIETSSPGLPGQSGGPIFDRDGHVWGIQSRTMTIDLGIQIDIQRDGLHPPCREYQCTNLGLGAYSSEVLRFLEEHGVSHQVSED